MAPHKMTLRKRVTALALACVTAASLVACGDSKSTGESGADGESVITPTTGVATPSEAADAEFQINQVQPLVTDELGGERVDDPGMKLSYTWQGTDYAPMGGSVVTVAVTNNDEVPMPVEALGTPVLKFTRNSSQEEAASKSAEAAGIPQTGLDMQLGPGATTNVHYAFDVTTGNLWKAEFTIGNVTFSGNLNN
ncbi:hypothetical protein QP027_08230 [Corynebacterium breve]|uniref:DUF5067 domain-containing protein n=1 Tax=Corynebacterium breve TaxID=3049799 RepID=A0ABY8VBR2_9CORY|nr:hypothetical protein [Corynebacterium breve]WIM67110.1 hypothetical protein QP027_08230 [Corynebacterium breve]